MKKILLLSVLLAVAGCNTVPPTIDLSDSIYSEPVDGVATNNQIAKLVIENTAQVKGKTKIPINPLKAVYSPVYVHPPASRTVEEDIRRYLETRFAYDSDSEQVIRVLIKEANAQRVQPRGPVGLILLVGPILDPQAKKLRYVLNLDLLITLEKNGKSVAIYIHDEPISVPARRDGKWVPSPYKELIAKYRQQLFGDLDEKFFKANFMQ